MADSVSLPSRETDPAVPLTWLCHPTLCSRGSTQRREAERFVGSASQPACRAAPCEVAGAQRRKGRRVGGGCGCGKRGSLSVAKLEPEQASAGNQHTCTQHLFYILQCLMT